MSSTKRTKSLPKAMIAATSQPTPPSRSAEKIADNDDLLIEILLRLPIKSLIKFKSVSKRWLSLVSDPGFSLRRNSISISTPISGLFLPRSSRSVTEISEFDFVNLNLASSSKSPFRSLPSASRIIQSCNGLLLYCLNKAPDPIENFVFNPTTKQCSRLPPICRVRYGANWGVLGLSLAFDPANSPNYKVICVLNCRGRSGLCRIDIYSSVTRCWRPLDEPFCVYSYAIRFGGGVYWNGSVHWISVFSGALYFNVQQERVHPLPVPLPPENAEDPDPRYRYLGESRGRLHLIDHIYDLQSPRFDVFEMEMDYSNWFAKFRVDLSDIPSSFPQILRRNVLHRENLHDYVFSVLCVVRGEVDEESYLVLQIPGKVLRYNLKTRTFFKLCDVEPSSSADTDRPALIDWSHAHQFCESLAFV